jgi:hypothetical protein
MSGSDCGRVAGSIPEELRFFIILYCTGQLYLSALRARKTEDRIPDSWDSRILGFLALRGKSRVRFPTSLEMNIIILGQ